MKTLANEIFGFQVKKVNLKPNILILFWVVLLAWLRNEMSILQIVAAMLPFTMRVFSL